MTKKNNHPLSPFLQAIKNHQWSLIGIAALIAIICGIIGFKLYGEANAQPDTFFSLIYKTLQLFTLNDGNPTKPLPWQLQLARFLAPAVVASSAIKAVFAIFREQIQFFRAGFSKNHVVICGLGRKGWLLASELIEKEEQKGKVDKPKQKEKKVVIIELDRHNRFIDQARRLGIIVLVGNANDTALLHQAGAAKASHLFALCGQDETNAEISINLRALVGDRKSNRLDCLIHIKNIELAGLLKEREIVAQRSDAFHLEIFNIYARGAQSLLSTYKPFADEILLTTPSPHLLIVGLGALGQSLVVQAAKRWIKQNKEATPKFSLTLVDPQASTIIKRLTQTYPRLRDICTLNTLSLETQSTAFQKGDFLTSNADSGAISQIYICLEDDAESITTALTLRQLLRQQAHKKNIPIIAQMINGDGLASLVKGELKETTEFDQISIFSLLEHTCKSDLLINGTNEIIAKSLHEKYVANEEKKGQTKKSNKAMAPWESLENTWKIANYRHADHVGEKLRGMGCSIVPLKIWDAAPFEFKPLEIETLAEQEHQRWVEERKEDGWRYTTGEKDEKKKTSPHMIPWDQLTDEIKDYDRFFIRDLPSFLANVGFEIIRINRPESQDE